MAEVWTKIRQTVDTSVADREWVNRWIDNDLKMLCGMIEEMFVENRATLLSPVMRQLLIDKARLVEKKRMMVTGRIVVDNPLDNLQEPNDG